MIWAELRMILIIPWMHLFTHDLISAYLIDPPLYCFWQMKNRFLVFVLICFVTNQWIQNETDPTLNLYCISYHLIDISWFWYLKNLHYTDKKLQTFWIYATWEKRHKADKLLNNLTNEQKQLQVKVALSFGRQFYFKSFFRFSIKTFFHLHKQQKRILFYF